jgi:hypothetical protein
MAAGDNRIGFGQNFANSLRERPGFPVGRWLSLRIATPRDRRHTTGTPAVSLIHEFDENMYQKLGKVKSGVQFFIFLSLVENRTASEEGRSVGI